MLCTRIGFVYTIHEERERKNLTDKNFFLYTFMCTQSREMILLARQMSRGWINLCYLFFFLSSSWLLLTLTFLLIPSLSVFYFSLGKRWEMSKRIGRCSFFTTSRERIISFTIDRITCVYFYCLYPFLSSYILHFDFPPTFPFHLVSTWNAFVFRDHCWPSPSNSLFPFQGLPSPPFKCHCSLSF